MYFTVDSDVLIFRDITKLYEICRSRKEPVSAVIDCNFKKISADTSWLSQLAEEEKDLPYFNCGIMYMRLSHEVIQTLFKKVEEAIKTAEKPFACADQTILNYVLRGKFHRLDNGYNLMNRRNRKMLGWNGDENIHYISAPKPFQSTATAMRFFIRDTIYHMFRRDEVSLRALEERYFCKGNWLRNFRKIVLYKYIKPEKYARRKQMIVSRRDYLRFKNRVQDLLSKRRAASSDV